MAYIGWLDFNDTELVNIARTAQLAEMLGIDSVWATSEQTQWIETALGAGDYDDVTTAPWYDAGYPASSEFAGIVSLAVQGLDDSTYQSSPIEYITDGGSPGKARNSILNLVANVALVATTERGAEYGLRWMNRTLRGNADNTFCAGFDLTYFRWAGGDSPRAHRRNVRLSRGSSVTRKRVDSCSTVWTVTFTLVAADPYEYGEESPSVQGLGGDISGQSVVIESGTRTLIQVDCPVFDYSPIYDPLYPALVAPPTAPDLLPAGWGIVPGMTFDRYWARVRPEEPSETNVVPMISLTTDVEARMVRVSVWDTPTPSTAQCDPLFSAVVSYLPTGTTLYIDGEQKAAYAWDGLSTVVRRTDSLIYSPDAGPVDWTAFTMGQYVMVTLDIFSESDGAEGDGTVRANFSWVPKSD